MRKKLYIWHYYEDQGGNFFTLKRENIYKGKQELILDHISNVDGDGIDYRLRKKLAKTITKDEIAEIIENDFLIEEIEMQDDGEENAKFVYKIVNDNFMVDSTFWFDKENARRYYIDKNPSTGYIKEIELDKYKDDYMK